MEPKMEFSPDKVSASNSQLREAVKVTTTERAWPRTLKEVWLLTWVVAVVISLSLLLRWLKLITLVRWLTPSRRCSSNDTEMLKKIARYTDGVLWRLAVSPKGNCLPRSLALYYFATRYGFPVRLCCGVRRMRNTLEGHAWLTLNGRPFLEHGNPELSYTVTFSFPPCE
jgi:hypothetical protein